MSLLSRVGVFGEHNEFGGCLVLASAYFFLKIILHTHDVHDVHDAQGVHGYVHGVCAWCTGCAMVHRVCNGVQWCL